MWCQSLSVLNPYEALLESYNRKTKERRKRGKIMISIFMALYKAMKESKVNKDFKKAIYYMLEAITGILFIITFIIICYLILR